MLTRNRFVKIANYSTSVFGDVAAYISGTHKYMQPHALHYTRPRFNVLTVNNDAVFK